MVTDSAEVLELLVLGVDFAAGTDVDEESDKNGNPKCALIAELG